ncbi:MULTISPECIES: VirD4-like conjugal transfer protein, CD1115 family [unclassified Clostridioides]|uniref:VirD4-like conjugal transfer protein, CD1115 family n=1 Tax=unclassified Clostridioides TaxID=2635829 RepID=UPI001D121A28|nr:type IV secretory system conjugative DNA transfer family protein [Clostridioides sp. ZZV14-6048]MCC0739996.1 type IV secretory system conjugative DNA transfer family protein [Clostridioides sp. ZZV14-5902]
MNIFNDIKKNYDEFLDTPNAEMKLAKKLINKDYVKKIFIVGLVAITLILNIVIELITSILGILNGYKLNIFRIFIPRWITCFPIYFIVYLVFIVVITKMIVNLRISFNKLEEGQKGTARFATLEEINTQYRSIPKRDIPFEGLGGIPIARNLVKDEIYIDDSIVNNLIIGMTRSGKGETFILPSLDIYSRAKNKISLVVNDPKGELAIMCKKIFEVRGFDTYLLNLIEPMNSMSYNPLQLVIDAYKKGEYDEAQLLCKTLTHSIYYNPSSKDPIWEKSAMSLVNALILAICDKCINEGIEEKITLYTVANMLSELGSKNYVDMYDVPHNALDDYFQEMPNRSVAKMQYSTSKFSAGNTRASIFTTAMSELQVFTFNKLAKLTSKTSINFEDVASKDCKPSIIFMATPDYDTSNHFVASMFVRQLYYVLAKKATFSKGGKCERRVKFLLDEFGNMPSIEGMANIITVCLGRGISFDLVVQSYTQLKSLYGDSMDTIKSNCGNKIYILTDDPSTLDEVSKTIGEKTIITNSRSGEVFSTSKSQTESLDSRRLLSPDELARLEKGEMVVIRPIKREDINQEKIKAHPIFNDKKRAMQHRYEYLLDTFNKEDLTLEDIRIDTLHKNVDVEDLLIDFEETSVELDEKIENLLKKKVNSEEEILEKYNEKEIEDIDLSDSEKYKIIRMCKEWNIDSNDIKNIKNLNSKVDIYNYLETIGSGYLSDLIEES